MRKIIFFLLLLLICFKIFSEDYDLGYIEVRDTKESENEKSDQIESFVTIVKINDEDRSKTLKEILENSAAVEIKSLGSESGVTTISIRGGSSNSVLILIDGIPINSSGSNQTDLSIINPALIERIEIIKGGNSSLYGANAGSGIINIITKKEGIDKRSIYFSGNPGDSIKAGLSLFFKKNIVNFLLSNSFIYDSGDFIFLNDNGTIYNKSDDYYDKRDNNSAFKISSLLNTKINMDKNSFLSFGINNSFNSNRLSGPKDFTILFKDAAFERDLLLFNINYNSGNLIKYFSVQGKINYKFDYYNYNNQNESSIKDRIITSYSNYFDTSVKFIFTEIPYNLLIVENSFSFETLDNSNLNGFKPFRITDSIIIRDEIVFYEDKIGIIPSTRFSFANDNYFYFSYNLGFFYNPNNYFKLKINSSGAYRNPDFFELYYSYGYNTANSSLKPEKSYGGDAGFIFNIKGFSIEFISFISYYMDLIKYILSYGYVYKPVNFAKSLSYGLEIKLLFNPVKFFKTEINYTLNFLNDIDQLANSRFYQLPGQPLHKANFIIEFLIDFFTFGIKANIEDRINITETASKFIKPKTVIDIFLKFNFKTNIMLFVFFNNITNIYTEDQRGYPLPGFNINMGANFEI